MLYTLVIFDLCIIFTAYAADSEISHVLKQNGDQCLWNTDERFSAQVYITLYGKGLDYYVVSRKLLASIW